MPKLIIPIIVIIIITVGIGAFFVLQKPAFPDEKDFPREITTFEECAKAGYPVGESYPRQCWTPDGRHFVEKLTNEPLHKIPIVKLSGGAAQLIPECADRNYITDTADYIIEGVVEKAEAKLNEQTSYINTYVALSIEKYVKGKSFGKKLQLQVSGGCVGGICQSSLEDVTFKQGDHLRLYLQKTETEFWIVCANFGVEQIQPI